MNMKNKKPEHSIRVLWSHRVIIIKEERINFILCSNMLEYEKRHSPRLEVSFPMWILR